MAYKGVFLLSFVFLLVLLITPSFVSAAVPPQTNVNVENGLQIFYPAYEVVKQNEDFFLHIHITDKSNGLEVASTLDYCYLHLYNPTGFHLLEENLTLDSNGIDWELYILGGNFSELGEHSFRIYCQDTFGGEVGGTFVVTRTGEVLQQTDITIVYALIALAFIFLVLSYFFTTEYWVLKSFFQFLAVLSGLIAVNSARILSSASSSLGVMSTSGLILIVVSVGFFFLWIFVKAFKEIINTFKKKGAVRWNYDD